jgi:hypothetical protein
MFRKPKVGGGTKPASGQNLWTRLKANAVAANPDMVTLNRQLLDDPTFRKQWVATKTAELRVRLSRGKQPAQNQTALAIRPTNQRKRRPFLVLISVVAVVAITAIVLLLGGLSTPVVTNAKPISTTDIVLTAFPTLDVAILIATPGASLPPGSGQTTSGGATPLPYKPLFGIVVMLEPLDTVEKLQEQYHPVGIIEVAGVGAFVPISEHDFGSCIVRSVTTGDTLFSIARQTSAFTGILNPGDGVTAIAQRNNIANVNNISVGQNLTICRP